MKPILASLIIGTLLLSGCATVIVDIDPEKFELEQIRKIKGAQAKVDPFAAEPTKSTVRVAYKDRVSIYANKGPDFKGPQDINLQSWGINAVNSNDEPKCVTIAWKLMDFSFDTNYPDEFYMPPETTIQIGKMRQSVWNFDGVGIALPPSGYVHDMRVRQPTISYKKPNKPWEQDEMCLQHDDEIEEEADEF